MLENGINCIIMYVGNGNQLQGLDGGINYYRLFQIVHMYLRLGYLLIGIILLCKTM